MAVGGGATKGDTMKMCSWRMQGGGLHVSVARMPPGMSRDAVFAELNNAVLKAQGWAEEKKDVGLVSCNLMTPPPGKQADPTTTSCLVIAKGMMLSAATITMTRLPMEKLKALVDSAAGRL